MKWRQRMRAHSRWLLLLFFTWGTYFSVLFTFMIRKNENGLIVGHPYVWSDWALHIGMARIFAVRPFETWFAHHPIFAGGKFTYGFLTNLISGLFMRVEIPVDIAFIVPSLLISLLLLLGMYFLFFQLTRSKAGSFLGISLFFLSSGLGFLDFWRAWFTHPTLEMLLYPPMDYSRIEGVSWLAGNSIAGLLLPQRAFLLGLMISVWSLGLLIFGLRHPLHNAKRYLLFGGFLAGLLPITHTHSFMVLAIIGLVLFIFRLHQWRHMMRFALPAGFLGLVLYATFISGGIRNQQFFQLNLWWTLDNFEEWLRFWWFAFGVMFPLGLWQTYQLLVKKQFLALHLSIAFWIVFLLANVIQFQPIDWDNAKMFFWVYLGFSALTGGFLAQWWKPTLWRSLTVGILLVILSGTGLLELTRLMRFDKNTYTLLSSDEIYFAEAVNRATEPLDIIATAPIHNHPIGVWSARPIVLGYTAWVWNFGFEYHQRETDVAFIYEHPLQAAALIQKYQIDYVALTPHERQRYEVAEEEFDEVFERVIETKGYALYSAQPLHMR